MSQVYSHQAGRNRQGRNRRGIQSELDIPVKYIGVGESIDDLQKFDADQFVNALFDVRGQEQGA